MLPHLRNAIHSQNPVMVFICHFMSQTSSQNQNLMFLSVEPVTEAYDIAFFRYNF